MDESIVRMTEDTDNNTKKLQWKLNRKDLKNSCKNECKNDSTCVATSVPSKRNYWSAGIMGKNTDCIKYIDDNLE